MCMHIRIEEQKGTMRAPPKLKRVPFASERALLENMNGKWLCNRNETATHSVDKANEISSNDQSFIVAVLQAFANAIAHIFRRSMAKCVVCMRDCVSGYELERCLFY